MLESPRHGISGRSIGLAIAGLAVLLLAAPVVRAQDAAGLEDIAALTRRVSNFAGAPARLDPRAL
ncbi:hypothetical protein, partial [Sandarakinorhabdus rubra]|uniref:hypothetical protein n=1 Tax=Sandarakinorhabdus rubra TaxID=2672568 RepID=UPI0013DB16ED